MAMAGLAMLGVSTALACVICVPYPNATHADALLASEVVVLAREDPAKPFMLAVTEVLKGSAGDVSTGVFLPSATRRRLKARPADGIIVVQRGKIGEWERLSYATPAYQAFVHDILAATDDWRGDRGQHLRFSFFADRLNDRDYEIRQQAFLEVGRAPYNWIKGVARSVPLEQVRMVLANWQLVEWHSLYILMLAQSNEDVDRAYIRKNFESAAHHGTTTNLSAWATAYFETHPDVAIERIEHLYFKSDKRKLLELEEILRALSVLTEADHPLLRGGTARLRWRISGAYASLLERHPAMAGWVARDLLRWRRKALVEPLTKLRRDHAQLDPGSALAVGMYLGQAAHFPLLTPPE
jgi:hypothetical protein